MEELNVFKVFSVPHTHNIVPECILKIEGGHHSRENGLGTKSIQMYRKADLLAIALNVAVQLTNEI